jgi:hypothetical protein
MNKLCAEVRHGGLNTIPHRAWGQGRGAGEGGRGDRYRNRFGLVEKKKSGLRKPKEKRSGQNGTDEEQKKRSQTATNHRSRGLMRNGVRGAAEAHCDRWETLLLGDHIHAAELGVVGGKQEMKKESREGEVGREREIEGKKAPYPCGKRAKRREGGVTGELTDSTWKSAYGEEAGS